MKTRKKITKKAILITKSVSLLFAVFLLNSCVAMPPLAERYHGMIQPPSGNERILDEIIIFDTRSGAVVNCTTADITLSSVHRRRSLGRDTGAFGRTPPERHHHEPVLDELLNEAQRRFPKDRIYIRSAAGGRMHGAWEEGNCRSYHFAYVVTPDPMPQPVAHSDTITVTPAGGGTITASDGSIIGHISVAQVTRADLYRRAHNWLTDVQTDRAQIQSADINLGRITGTYTFVVWSGLNYIINSNFIIDVHDASAQIRFENTVQHRSEASPAEPILLQSVANMAHAELVTFSDALIARIISPQW